MFPMAARPAPMKFETRLCAPPPRGFPRGGSPRSLEERKAALSHQSGTLPRSEAPVVVAVIPALHLYVCFWPLIDKALFFEI